MKNSKFERSRLNQDTLHASVIVYKMQIYQQKLLNNSLYVTCTHIPTLLCETVNFLTFNSSRSQYLIFGAPKNGRFQQIDRLGANK